MVGFPGETEAQFAEMLRLVEELEFDHLGAFAYSREEGTRAARMSGQVPERTAARRLRELMLLQRVVVRNLNRRQRGRIVEAVIERPTRRADVWLARTRTQAPDVDGVTRISGAGLRAGRFVQAIVTGFRGYDSLARTLP